VSADHDDYAVEPIRGLPENLPEGEHILWQGAPEWRELAKHVFHLRAVAGYFAVLMAWRASVHLDQGSSALAAILSGLSLLPVSLVGLGLLALLAALCARTSVYTITNRRLVLRIGVALPVAINIPFRTIAAASLACRSNGCGDIPLALAQSERMSYPQLWPHARPWAVNHPQPMLRGIRDAKRVAELLSRALADAHHIAYVATIAANDEHAPSALIPAR
jgi:hypothetical protein